MKSYVSDLLELACILLEEAHARCLASDSLSLSRDLQTVVERTKHEGLSFLTIALPAFADGVTRSLESGEIDSLSFPNWRKNGVIPAFLQGILSQVFSRSSGKLSVVQEGSPDVSQLRSLYALRVFCMAFKKLQVECAEKRVHQALLSFEQTEKDLDSFEVSAQDRSDFIDTARALWDPVVSRLRIDDLVPRHGPGTTAEGLSGNRKYVWASWSERLEAVLPFLDNGYTVSAVDSQEFSSVDILPEDRELACRVVTVPKTLKTPRIIAVEPACNQYAQQALRAPLYVAIALDSLAGGQVNFTDQKVNQSMALTSSVDGSRATLDLSEASDRVIWSLAREMFASNPDIQWLVEASRTRYAKMPGGRVIGPLAKFASMGNALTFPVESMYFYAICVMGLCRSRSLPLTYSSFRKVGKEVYVYGDDLIVPAADARCVVDHLQKYNCKVNTRKSYFEGNFRESCGVDAWFGSDVTPIYVRAVIPTTRSQASETISTCATANQFAEAGWTRVAEFLFRKLEVVLGGPLPSIHSRSSALGRVAYYGERLTMNSWDRKSQRRMVWAWTPSSVRQQDRIDGYAALTKSLSIRMSDPYGFYVREPDHLEMTDRPYAVTLKRRRVPVL